MKFLLTAKIARANDTSADTSYWEKRSAKTKLDRNPSKLELQSDTYPAKTLSACILVDVSPSRGSRFHIPAIMIMEGTKEMIG